MRLVYWLVISIFINSQDCVCIKMSQLNHGKGTNITSLSSFVYEMKNALESQCGVVNSYVSIIDVDMAKQPPLSGQLKSCSISQFNNFIFDNEGLRIFEAYGIGEEQISSHSLEAISKTMPENSRYQVI